MIVFITTNGTVQTVLPSPVYQGQGITGSLYLVAPFPNTNGADVAFTLANGDSTQTYALSPSAEVLPDVFTQDGEQYSVWEWQTDNAFVTKYAGQVTAQMRVYAFDDKGNKNTIATAAVNFTVQKGVIPLNTTTPTPNQWANLITLYSQVKAAETANAEAIAKKVDKANKASVVYSTDFNGKDTTFPYNASPVPVTFPIRDGNGEIAVATATKDTSAVPRKQLNEALDKKLDKSTTTTTVYANGTDGKPTNIPYSKSEMANSIAYRGSNGTLNVKTAQYDNEAVPKHQLDSELKAQYQEIIGEVGEAVSNAKEAADKALVASENALQAAADVEQTKYKLDNIEARLNENIIKDPSKTYLVWKGSEFTPSSDVGLVKRSGLTIDWGDGTIETFENTSTEIVTHTYTDGIEYHLIAIEVPLIDAGSFWSYDGLISIAISNNIDSISNYTFTSDSNLVNVIIPDSVTSIGEGAFNGCRNLTDIIIPDGVTSISYNAFNNCDKLKKITIKATSAPSIASNAFSTVLEKIIVPKSAINAYKSAPGWSQYADKIVYEVDSSDIPDTSDFASMSSGNVFHGRNIFTAEETEFLQDVTVGRLSGSIVGGNLFSTVVAYRVVEDYIAKTEYKMHKVINVFRDDETEKGTEYTVSFPEKSGTFALLSDIPTVVANPSSSATEELKKITVGEKTYSIPEGGGTSDLNIENGSGNSSVQQKYIKDGMNYSAQAKGEDSVAFGGKRYNKLDDATRTATSAEGAQSLAQGGSSHSYGDFSVAMTKDNKSYQGASFTAGGGNQTGRTEEEFNTYFWDSTNNVALHDGKGKDSNGNILDAYGDTYAESYSFGGTFGELNTNKGRSSLIAGMGNATNCEYSIVAGSRQVQSQGENHIIAGFQNSVSGSNHCVSGSGNSVDGDSNTVSGSGNSVDGQFNITHGQSNLSYSVNSANLGYKNAIGYTRDNNLVNAQKTATRIGDVFVAGAGNTASHEDSGLIGIGLKTGKHEQIAVGKANIGKEFTIFEVGNGDYVRDDAGNIKITSRKNAFEVLGDGRAKVQTAPVDNDDVVRKIDLNAAIGGEDVTLTGTSGTLTPAQLTTLQASDNNYIICDNEIYRIAKKSTGGLTYTCNGYKDTGAYFQRKVIQIAISNRNWLVHNETDNVIILGSVTSGTLTDEQFEIVKKDNAVIVWMYIGSSSRIFHKNATIYSSANVVNAIEFSWKSPMPAIGDYGYDITIGADKSYSIARQDPAGYYRHNVRLSIPEQGNTPARIIYYDYISRSSVKATNATIRLMEINAMIPLTVLIGGLYSTINGSVYRAVDNVNINIVAHGVYATSATSFGYLNITGEVATIDDDIVTIIT